MRLSLATVLLTLSFACAASEDVVYAEAPKGLPDNSYAYFGNWIVCVVKAKTETCDRIDPFRVGDKIPTNLEPYQEIPQPDGSVSLVLLIHAPKDHSGYFVVTHKNGVITSVQLTADFKVKEFHFSTISPGDDVAKVDRAFGPRFVEKPNPEIKGTIRYYHPFPFSIEFANGVVYSVRVGE